MSFTARFKKRFYFVVAGYFRFFANHAFKKWHPRVIAITGSVGKTTMLHMVEYEIGKKAHYSHNANSAFGIAFDLVGIKKGVTGSKLRWLYLFFAVPLRSLFFHHKEEFYVVEIDGERPHETEFLAKWLRPEITLWISLGRSHAIQFEHQVENGEFEDLDRAITHEFAMLPQYTQKKIYIDGDIYLMTKALEKIKKHHHIKAEVVECYKSDLKGYVITPKSTDYVFKDTSFHFASPQPRALAIQLVMLKKLCKYLKVKLKTDFSGMPLPPGRSSYFPGKNGLTLIDSSYNAHLISVESILEMAANMKERHLWIVLGDMIEQGKIEGEEHRKLAEAIKKAKPEQVILVGRRTKKYTYPQLDKERFNVIALDNVKQALKFIEENTTGKEVLVFKGSQYLEWLVEKLLENPDDATKLPRRDPIYIKRREKRGLK
ncbi:hypothetical protein IJH10_01870 [Candidatus Saccharibacteria bacterium]|nr:hypothetical protein [Candidatus Saccharibacteria bacterium]MBQ7617724.1 hypothetical protein [Desulfovibrio sp.]